MSATWSYATIAAAPVDGYVGITDGSRHVLAPAGDPGVPAAAQRRVNAAKGAGRPAAAADLAETGAWLDRHLVQEQVQAELFAA